MLGSTWCIGPPSPRGVDGAGRRRQRAGPVQDVHPTWDNGSTSHGSDPGLQYALVAHQSHQSRQRQMPLVEPVSYSFQAKEDTAPGRSTVY